VELLNQAGSAGENYGIQRIILSGGKPSFQSLLDDVCERLQDTRQQGSLRRIQKLEKILNILEEELDEIQAIFQDAHQAGTIQEKG
jgi:ABC-type transporter Mla subunit MlaD